MRSIREGCMVSNILVCIISSAILERENLCSIQGNIPDPIHVSFLDTSSDCLHLINLLFMRPDHSL